MIDPVAEARALLAAATPGPWHVGDPDTLNPRVDAPEWAICHVYDDDERPYDPDDDRVPLDPTPLADAALIAAAPDLLARLCDEIERLRAAAAARDAARARVLQAWPRTLDLLGRGPGHDPGDEDETDAASSGRWVARYVTGLAGLDHVDVDPDRDLLRRALLALRPRRGDGPLPRWALVKGALFYGSGVSRAICLALGIDPDEVIP